MLSLLFTAMALLGADSVASSPPATTSERDSYEAALAQVGRDADAHVRLALWCEEHGLDAERGKHLTLAVLKNPTHPIARGLLGLVAHNGRWKHPADVGAAVRADAARADLIAQYEEKRGKVANTADAHWKLALWCEEHGLKAESVAHLWSSLRLDPSREAAWKRLGYKKQDGRWMTDAQIASAKGEAKLQKEADKQWRPLLEKWRKLLSDKDPEKRAAAEKGLARVDDPRAVPSIFAVFAIGDEPRQQVAVQVFGQIDAAEASRALAMLAVFSKSAEVRRTATETLVQRDLREFAEMLVTLVQDPIKYEVRRVGGPGSPGELFVQGKDANLKRLYSPPSVPNVPLQPGDRLSYDAGGLPVLMRNGPILGSTRPMTVPEIFGATSPQRVTPAQRQRVHEVFAQSGLGAQGAMIEKAFLANPLLAEAFSFGQSPSYNSIYQSIAAASLASMPGMANTNFSFTLGVQAEIPIGRMAVEAEKSALAAQQQLENDVASIERYNHSIAELNGRVLPILNRVSGQDLGADREGWTKWWIDQIGYTIMPQKSSETTTVVENVPLAYQPQPVPIESFVSVVGFFRMSCFGAGTPVHTLTGTRPIESLKVGDEVLTQDVKTGALGYQPVLVVHHNPPSKTFQIRLGGETIVSSEFHRFWKARKGWVMARDLEVGDSVRTLGNLVKVEAIEPGPVQPVYNLDVAENADFFVGASGALVHDNTLPDLRLSPFDAAPVLATTSRP